MWRPGEPSHSLPFIVIRLLTLFCFYLLRESKKDDEREKKRVLVPEVEGIYFYFFDPAE
jgi:hypothetical protein